MIRILIRAVLFVLANAIGLLAAILLLPGFTVGPAAFIYAVLLFSVIEALLGPFITKFSLRNVPGLAGGVALVTTFLGLWICALLLDDMTIGGIANHLAATLLVWLGAVIATLILPMFMFKKYMEEHPGR